MRALRAVVAVFTTLMSLGCFRAEAQSAAAAARDELNLGVQAYREARYEAAIQHFRNATSFEPTLVVAHLYLATAFAQQYIPGAETQENVHWAEQAIHEYKRVLELDANSPSASNAIKGIAALYFNMKKFDDSKWYHKLAIERNPNDAEEHYSIAVLDWTLAYGLRTARMEKLHLEDLDYPLINETACPEVRKVNLDNVEDGIRELTKALELRPDYDDAMAYMNLLYRERAQIQCGDPAAHAADIKKADEWVDLTLATKKAKAERTEGGEGREPR